MFVAKVLPVNNFTLENLFVLNIINQILLIIGNTHRCFASGCYVNYLLANMIPPEFTTIGIYIELPENVTMHQFQLGGDIIAKVLKLFSKINQIPIQFICIKNSKLFTFEEFIIKTLDSCESFNTALLNFKNTSQTLKINQPKNIVSKELNPDSLFSPESLVLQCLRVKLKNNK